MEDDLIFKQHVYGHFKKMITDRVDGLQQKLEDVISMTQNETKSSAGDKYETARAMLQIEQNLIRGQLAEAITQKAIFDKLSATATSRQITNGSLINTSKGYLYLSIALGKAIIGQHKVIALSAQSPLGSKLLGHSLGDTVTFNGAEYFIKTIT